MAFKINFDTGFGFRLRILLPSNSGRFPVFVCRSVRGKFEKTKIIVSIRVSCGEQNNRTDSAPTNWSRCGARRIMLFQPVRRKTVKIK